jgi:xanthine phosphoribosyltransferase
VGKAFASTFRGREPDKVLTVEASGIAPACFTSYFLKVPMVYAKKKLPKTLGDDVYFRDVLSKTRGESIPLAISKRYLRRGEKVVILDDFLATGNTALALTEMIEEAGGEFSGFGVIIEKVFEGGRKNLIKAGLTDEDIFSLVKIKRLDEDRSKIEFL